MQWIRNIYSHEYDFCSTTRLKLKVISEYERPIGKKKIVGYQIPIIVNIHFVNIRQQQ